MTVPVLETESLILRGKRLEDFPAHLAMWSDPRTVAIIGHPPRSEEDHWLRFQRHFGQWSLAGYGSWAVEDKASGAYAGSLGFFEAKRAIDVPYRDLPEIGWVVAPQFHNRGYAREGVGAALA
jgi:RimJ/RimL family protein N-acetyltransferase